MIFDYGTILQSIILIHKYIDEYFFISFSFVSLHHQTLNNNQMEIEIIIKLNELEDYLINRSDVNSKDFQEIIKHTQGIRSELLKTK
jgi:hypothetical protein